MPSIGYELQSTSTAQQRHKGYRPPIGRQAGEIPSAKVGAVPVAEAKVSAFWPYRQCVIKIGDAFDMQPFEWASAYLRALAAWAGDNRPLAACHPADPPGCVAEDMKVLAASRGCRADEPAVAFRAARLAELARAVIGRVLGDDSITPVRAFNSVRAEVHQLLVAPAASVADQVVRLLAELSDEIIHQDASEAVLTADRAGQILGMLNGLGSLLADLGPFIKEPQGAVGGNRP